MTKFKVGDAVVITEDSELWQHISPSKFNPIHTIGSVSQIYTNRIDVGWNKEFSNIVYLEDWVNKLIRLRKKDGEV